MARTIRTRHLTAPLFAGVMALFVAACAQDEGRDLERLPAYQAGYNEGCRTAHARERAFASEVFRDDDRFEQDAAYRAGWREGSMVCGTSDGLGRNRMFDEPRVGPERL